MQRASPNCDQRPQGAEVSLLVIHNISLPPGEFGGPWIDMLFNNCLPVDVHPYFQAIADLRVSSHLLIRRDGSTIQYVPFDKRAWHAGESAFQDRAGCNDYSIGIELEGTDEIPYTREQYQALAQITRKLMENYPKITRERIVGHADIAHGRKTDPGPAFDWGYYRSLLVG